MPRRPPPSSLLLVKGPIPIRGQAKHTLPSVPRPVHVPADVSRTIGRAAPEPKILATSSSDTVYDASSQSSKDMNAGLACGQPRRRSVERGLDTSGLALLSIPSLVDRGIGVQTTISSGARTGVGSPPSRSPLATPSAGRSPSPQPPSRGPWDHPRVVSLPIDVSSVLALPKPVAISP